MITKKETRDRAGRRPILVATAILVVAVAWLVWYTINFQNSLVETTALESAELYSHALTEFRMIYSAEVVQKVDSFPGFEITHDYQGKENAIPLPATLSMELGEKIGTHLSGAESWLYSEYPFPWRKNTATGRGSDSCLAAGVRRTRGPGSVTLDHGSVIGIRCRNLTARPSFMAG